MHLVCQAGRSSRQPFPWIKSRDLLVSGRLMYGTHALVGFASETKITRCKDIYETIYCTHDSLSTARTSTR